MKMSLSLRTLELLWWPVVGAVAILVFIAVMALSAGQSLWFDEGYSILLAKSNWHELFALTAVDAHPPLYYALLKIWGSLFGFGEFALRSLSAVALSGVVVMVAVLLRRLFSAKVALLALPVIILGPFLLRYGYEVRMYSLALLIGVTATYALVVAVQGRRWWQWAMYAALVALGMYTLYMTLVVWLAHVVWLFVQSLKKPRKPFLQWQWLYAYIGAVVLFIPYIPTFLYQTINSALPGIGNEITITGLVDMVTVLATFRSEWQVGGWLSLLILAGIALTIWVGVRTYRHIPKQQKTYYGLLALLVVVPIVFYIVTSLPPRDPIFVNRYLAQVALFIYAFIAVTLALGIMYRQKLKAVHNLPFVAYGIVVVIFALGLIQLHTVGNFVFERQQLPRTEQLRSDINCSPQTTIVADDPYTYIDSVFYFDSCDLRFYSQKPVEKKGGYAPLHDSKVRLADSLDLNSETIVRLGWEGNKAQFVPDTRYKLVDVKTYDKQRVETYRLSAE